MTLVIITAVLLVYNTFQSFQSCDGYKHGHRSGEKSERDKHDEREDRENRELREQEPRTIFTEQEIADLKGASVGGKMNCTVCVACLQPVKACHSLCRQCNSICQPSACNIRPTEKPNILNSITDTRLRKEGPSD